MLVDRTWTMAEAKRDFGYGLLADYGMQRVMGEWSVVLSGTSMRGALVDARGKTPRMFKTLDAAVSALEQIGFSVQSMVKGVL